MARYTMKVVGRPLPSARRNRLKRCLTLSHLDSCPAGFVVWPSEYLGLAERRLVRRCRPRLGPESSGPLAATFPWRSATHRYFNFTCSGRLLALFSEDKTLYRRLHSQASLRLSLGICPISGPPRDELQPALYGPSCITAIRPCAAGGLPCRSGLRRVRLLRVFGTRSRAEWKASLP